MLSEVSNDRNSPTLHHIYLIFILILPYQPHIVCQIGLLSPDFPSRILCVFITSPLRVHAQAVSSPLIKRPDNFGGRILIATNSSLCSFFSLLPPFSSQVQISSSVLCSQTPSIFVFFSENVRHQVSHTHALTQSWIIYFWYMPSSIFYFAYIFPLPQNAIHRVNCTERWTTSVFMHANVQKQNKCQRINPRVH